jgi:hypothetical protein
MKKQIDLPFLGTLCGAVLFSYLFWMEQLALNLLLYSLFILIVIVLNQEIVKNKKMLLTAVAHLFSALLVVINHSDLTIIAWYISLSIFIGFTYLPTLRSVFAAISASVLQAITSPVNLAKQFITLKFGNFSFRPIFRPVKYLIIPLALVILFSILYSLANPTFSKYLWIILDDIGNFFSSIFSFFFADISLPRVFHFLLGLLVSAALLLRYYNETLEKTELSFLEKLIRRRKPKKQPIVVNGFAMPPKPNTNNKKMALKTMNIIGIISFVCLNLLILSLNLLDVTTLWVMRPKPSNFNFSAEVHEGTNILIWSIVLAMMVILYFFRGNINFYSKSKTIKLLAYIWIIQNTFLVASVLLRDYNYINMHGLTYKRIGVLIFLFLCLIGLITVYIKVNKQKTFFYLIKTNGFVWYCLLMVSGIVNWDVFIMQYNINYKHATTIDLEHSLRLSNKVIPLLDENRTLLKAYIPNHKWKSTGNQALTYKQEQENHLDWILNYRINKFKLRWKNTTWLSWNYRDWQTHRYLQGTKR